MVIVKLSNELLVLLFLAFNTGTSCYLTLTKPGLHDYNLSTVYFLLASPIVQLPSTLGVVC